MVGDQSSLERHFIAFRGTVEQKWDEEIVETLRRILQVHLKGSVSIQSSSISNGRADSVSQAITGQVITSKAIGSEAFKGDFRTCLEAVATMLGITQIDFIGHIKTLAADGAEAAIEHLDKLVHKWLKDPNAQAIIRPRLDSLRNTRMLLVTKIQQGLDEVSGVHDSEWTMEMLLDVLRYWVNEAWDSNTEVINPYDDADDLLELSDEMDESAEHEVSDREDGGQAESPGAVKVLPNVIAQQTAADLEFLIKPPTPEAFLATLKKKGNFGVSTLFGETTEFTAITTWMKTAFIDAYLTDLKFCAEKTVRNTIVYTAEAGKKELEKFMVDHNVQLKKQIVKPEGPSEELLNCLCAYGNLTAIWGANERLREHLERPKALASAFELPRQSPTAL